jgi:hypothetical protein
MAGYYLQMKPIELSGRLALMTSQLSHKPASMLVMLAFRFLGPEFI